jgi:hypothetical protein
VADAVYWTIMSALENQLQALPGVSVLTLRQKVVALPTENLPLTIIAPPLTGGTERIKRYLFGNQVIWTYPVDVLLLTPGNRKIATGEEAYLLNRQTFRDTILATLPVLAAASTVYDLELAPLDVTDYEAFVVGNYDLTGFSVDYDSLESHN